MPTFSRWMPPTPKPGPPVTAWLVFGTLLIALGWGAVVSPGGRWALGLLVPVWAARIVSDRRRLHRLATNRLAEDIGTFARAFDRRAEPFDPRVVRAVWDAFQPYVSLSDQRFPLRPSDRIDEDLQIDWDDIGTDLIAEVARRAGRSLDRLDDKSLFGRVVTVGDLVRFLSGQPKRAAA
jgi:hypothetical protein